MPSYCCAGPKHRFFGFSANKEPGRFYISAMLTLTGIRKCFGSITAVDDLSLKIRRGEIFGLLGPNGAGKSTTVHMAVGLVEPDHGTVAIEGLGSPVEPSVRARMGLAPQALSLYAALTGEENLTFFGRMYGLSGQRLRERVAAALAFVGLTDRRGDLVRDYSGGMKRRLNLAGAILHEPDLILLDEPTVGVDPQSRNSIFENILELRRQGRTIVYTTHYMEEAERLCDRVGIMDHGRMLALDTVTGLLARYGGVPALVAETMGKEIRIETQNPLAELNRLSELGPIENFRVERSSLEQVFLNLTGRNLRD
jgi:ABC-2 type transport system ATP-binding protein